jgi:hypothetical protein
MRQCYRRRSRGTQFFPFRSSALRTRRSPRCSLDDVVGGFQLRRRSRHGLSRCKEGFPLSNRLIRGDMHWRSTPKRAGKRQVAGRVSDVTQRTGWEGKTGNALFVPPPPEIVSDCMLTGSSFPQPKATNPGPCQAALSHAQFETIHPFLTATAEWEATHTAFSSALTACSRHPCYTSASTSKPTDPDIRASRRDQNRW